MRVARRLSFVGLVFLPLLALAAFALILSACGDDGGAGPTSPTPTEESRTVTSDDGKLTLEIPPGALDEEIEITITSATLDELPQELRVLQGAGTGYRLEPDGLEFSEPVAVSLELDAEELEDEPEDGIAAYALVSLTEDGEREMLNELVTEAALGEETMVARGELSHFSWITRTKGSLVVSLQKVPRDQPVGGTFKAKGQVGNGDLTNTVTLEDPSGTFLAFGTVSTSGNTTFDSDAVLSPGAAVKGTGTFQCGQSPGLGTYTLRGKATSVVVVDKERLETPLTVIVDGVINCVASASPTPTPTPTPATEPTTAPTPAPTEEPGAFADPTGDAFFCDSGAPADDPAVDIHSVDVFPGPPLSGVRVVTGQPPPGIFDNDFSYAIQVQVDTQGGIAQIHDGVPDMGIFGPDGTLMPGTEGSVTIGPDGTYFFFPDPIMPGDMVNVQTFHTGSEGDNKTCDSLEITYTGLE